MKQFVYDQENKEKKKYHRNIVLPRLAIVPHEKQMLMCDRQTVLVRALVRVLMLVIFHACKQLII